MEVYQPVENGNDVVDAEDEWVKNTRAAQSKAQMEIV